MGFLMLDDILADYPIRIGRLTIIDPDGQDITLQGEKQGPEATIRISEKKLLRRIALIPDLYLGEGYMDGKVTVEEGTLFNVLDFCACNLMPQATNEKPNTSKQEAIKRNVIGIAKQNVAHHYDLSRDLFKLFLDEDMQYSCAYFASDKDTLEQAQQNKKKRLAQKLLLKPGMRILDIGSGWGGLGLHLAQAENDIEVVGVTLSTEQQQVAQQRAEQLGLADRVTFKLLDYRQEDDQFDRIVSVGMFEHVGSAHYNEFFKKISDLLTDDGVCLLHSIGRMAPPGLPVTWINKYIFPGGYTPSMSETVAVIENTGLWITDIEVMRLHYAKTLQNWHIRFQQNREKAANLYDERFCRMWEFYLQICEIAFRRLNWMVFQMQISKTADAVPINRSYMAHWDKT